MVPDFLLKPQNENPVACSGVVHLGLLLWGKLR